MKISKKQLRQIILKESHKYIKKASKKDLMFDQSSLDASGRKHASKFLTCNGYDGRRLWC